VLARLSKKLPPLKGAVTFWQTLAIALVVIGVTLGIFSAVRSGSILVAVGGALYAYVSYTTSETKRTIELLIPIGVTLLLFVVSLTLPHAK
jgi:uncharacterized membrane protein